MGKARKIASTANDKSQEQKKVSSKKGTERREDCSLSYANGHLLKKSEFGTEIPKKYRGRVVLRGDIVKYDSGSHAVFTEQGSSASQMTAAKVMDIIARLPDYDGQTADAISAYTQEKWRMLKNYSKFPNQNV